MVEFFTVLLLIYHVGEEPWETKVLYDRESRCQEAMDSGIVEPLYDQLFDLYGGNIMMTCHVTNLVSKSHVRPRKRPDFIKE